MVFEPMFDLLCGEALVRISVEESNVEVGGVAPVVGVAVVVGSGASFFHFLQSCFQFFCESFELFAGVDCIVGFLGCELDFVL